MPTYHSGSCFNSLACAERAPLEKLRDPSIPGATKSKPPPGAACPPLDESSVGGIERRIRGVEAYAKALRRTNRAALAARLSRRASPRERCGGLLDESDVRGNKRAIARP